MSGAWVLLTRGRPVLYVGKRGNSLISFPETIRDEQGSLEAAIEMLRHLPSGTSRGMLVIKKIDGVEVNKSRMLEPFLSAGYATDYRGLIDIQVPDHAPAGRTAR